MAGRISIYTEELANELCEWLANGKSLASFCRQDDKPAASTIYYWLDSNKAFLDKYTRAKEDCADYLAEEILDISDDAENDYMKIIDSEGATAYKLNGENVQRSRLRVESRKWIASKLKPKKYGDKLNLGGQDDNPIKIDNKATIELKSKLLSTLTDEQLEQLRSSTGQLDD